jgi:selenium metabolism protein YedF
LKDKVILIESDAIGSPDEKLGRLLMVNFLKNLGAGGHVPSYIILLNGGVLLASKDSDALEHLCKFEEGGVKIISCRTCVEYFDVERKLAVGEIDGMPRIVELLSTHTVLTV